MRCILTGCLGVALGWTATGRGQDAVWHPGPALDGRKPAVTLGPPTVSLGAPRPLAATARPSGVAPCAYTARGKVDDKAPMPPGPQLPAAPAGGTSTLSPPTPLTPAMPVPAGAIYTGPVTSGPIGGEMVIPGGPVAGAPCPTCGPGDPNWAPLPGGSFVADGGPGGSTLYGSAEYLLWWTRGANLPPLLTATTPAGSMVLVGNETVDDELRSGGRFTVGGWFTPCQNWGVVGSMFFLGSRGTGFAAASMPGGPVLSRPYIDPLPSPAFTREILSTFAASTKTDLWGADINLRKNIWADCRGRLDGLAGFRYLRLRDELTISETSMTPSLAVEGVGVPAGTFTPVTVGALTDQFKVTNDFYGGQLGLIGEWKRGPWCLEMTTKVALGSTHQTVTATGAQAGTFTGPPPFGVRTFNGPGLYVQPSNAGTRSQDSFSVVPEVGLNLGYQVRPHVKVFVGYDFLYWTNVLRAGDQIDPVLNIAPTPVAVNNGVSINSLPLTQRAGMPIRPIVPFRETDFWAQGINFGVQFTW